MKGNLTASEIVALENEVKDIIERKKVELDGKILEKNMDGVKEIGNSPNCVIVQASSLLKGKVLAAETYIQSGQAKAIKSKLDGCKTMTDVIEKISSMIETGVIREHRSGYTLPLNPQTIKVLKDFLAEV